MSAPSSSQRPRLDAIDLAILARLQQHGRETNAGLARRVGLTPPAVLDRVRRLEDAGVIRGYRADLDPEALGFGLTVLLTIRLDHHGRAAVHAFRDAVAGLDEVVECHYVTGSADFLLKVRARDVRDYRRLLESSISTLPGVRQVESAVVLETFKDSRDVALGPPD